MSEHTIFQKLKWNVWEHSCKTLPLWATGDVDIIAISALAYSRTEHLLRRAEFSKVHRGQLHAAANEPEQCVKGWEKQIQVKPFTINEEGWYFTKRNVWQVTCNSLHETLSWVLRGHLKLFQSNKTDFHRQILVNGAYFKISSRHNRFPITSWAVISYPSLSQDSHALCSGRVVPKLAVHLQGLFSTKLNVPMLCTIL